MYIALLLILLLPAGYLLRTGRRRNDNLLLAGGILWAAVVALFFAILHLWGEMLWFESLGFTQRFWTELWAKYGIMALAALFSASVTFLMAGAGTMATKGALGLAAFLGGRWGLLFWQEILLFFNREETSLRDPVFRLSTGFYLFALPALDGLCLLVLQAVMIGFIAHLAAHYVVRLEDNMVRLGKTGQEEIRKRWGQRRRRLYLNGAVIAFVLAASVFVLRYHLLYSQWGTVSGPGWSDVHIRLPGYDVLCALFVVAGGWLLFVAGGRFRVNEKLPRLEERHVPAAVLGSTAGLAFIAAILLLMVIPGLFQWLRVEPNEITLEEPYIEHNIRFTRHGYGLDRVEEREFSVSGDFTPGVVAANTGLLENIRLWDRGALDAVYKQFQEIRLYYEFVGVDIDRYMVDGDYRQVMVSAREMQQANLPQQSRTFVNKRFKYTHGYGITMTPVSEFTSEGLPDLFIKDIPPVSDYPDLAMTRPEIYYGELTDSHVVVNSREGEFDYPKGEQNVYIHYPGKGGVVLADLWRKFLFGWKFDGTRFFLSSYPTSESRILFHRQIEERVKTVAPFLHFDDDPYITLHEGRLSWICDAYTTSTYYPYSAPFSSREDILARNGAGGQLLSSRVNRHLSGVNYIRNSVKAVVDAFDGTVTLYVYEPDDPLISAWRRIFPGLFKDRGAMPPSVAAHVRYPTDLLLVQGLVYAKYHMTDPRVFYNQEDLWIRATEKYYNRVQPLQPYYVMWELPESDDLEFTLILPFTPKNRQVMIGWVAGLCDGDNYGRLLVYKFPKKKRVLGPQQVETKIDQDRFLSGQLTLWDQRGSQVIRGNVLAIPIEQTILYVEPIYLQAETAAYPELRLVVLMHDDRLTYAPTFDRALEKLLTGARDVPALTGEGPGDLTAMRDIMTKADEAFSSYLERMGDGDFDQAAESLARLQQLLQQMVKGMTPVNPEERSGED